MALPKAHHIETLSKFNSLKFSYDSTNTHYFTGGTDTIVEGTPDILYTDIAYIKPLSAIYTHAKIYPCPVLEYDTEPTTNSGNLMTSGNIKSALDNNQRVFYAVTETAGSTAVKEFTIPNFPTETINGVKTPLKGTILIAKCANADARSAQLKFKVNDGGEFPIKVGNAVFVSSNLNPDFFGSTSLNYVYSFDGSNWCWISKGYDTNTTYTPQSLGFGYASCTTAALTTAKTASLSTYKLVNGGFVTVYFQYDVPAQATLDINNQGAKAIHFGSSRLASDVIKAGDKCLFMYNGNSYVLIAIDRWGKELQEKVSGINISETDFEALSTYEQGKLYFVFDNNS